MKTPKRAYYLLLIGLLIANLSINGQQKKEVSFADHWEYIGVAIDEPGYTTWGTSPILDEQGKTHLFVARWPSHLKVDPGWRTHSQIAHYVGDSPEGPFSFVDIAIQEPIESASSSKGAVYAPHNPTIHKIDSLYALFYIVNDGRKEHPSNQHICLATSKSLNGPWEKAGKILSPPNNPNYWNYQARNGVNNPAFLKHPQGGFFLYFKSSDSKGSKMGLAIAENLKGPYVQLPFPVTKNNQIIEDGYAFSNQNKFYLLTTDNHGMIEAGGGILWKSDDGIHFDNYEKGFHRINNYTKIDLSKVAVHYGVKKKGYAKFERPQILFIKQKPSYLYAPSGTNIYGKDHTVSYILKFKE